MLLSLPPLSVSDISSADYTPYVYYWRCDTKDPQGNWFYKGPVARPTTQSQCAASQRWYFRYGLEQNPKWFIWTECLQPGQTATYPSVGDPCKNGANAMTVKMRLAAGE